MNDLGWAIALAPFYIVVFIVIGLTIGLVRVLAITFYVVFETATRAAIVGAAIVGLALYWEGAL